MASAKDDVFLKVEAVLSNEWIKNSGRDLTAILEEVENLGVEGINFQRGNHVITGSLEQLSRVREHFLGKEKRSSSKGSEKRTAASSDKEIDYSERWPEPKRNPLPRKVMFSEAQKREVLDEVDTVRAVQLKKSPLNSGNKEEKEIPSGNKDQQISKELMVDNDIWDYIENKKNEELKHLEDMFAANVVKAEDDSGVLKISINPKSKDTALEDVSLMHETLVGLYQDTFMSCVIEKHEVHFSDEEAELVLEYISEKFPDVFAKRCIYNDDFLFIGHPRRAREARQQFQVLSQRLKKGQLKARMDERLGLDDYDRPRRRWGSYEDRYNDLGDPYESTTYRYPNDFNNSSNEDMVVEENHGESFTRDEVRVISPVDDTPGQLSNKISNEEEEQIELRQKPEVNLSKDFDLPAVRWNQREKNKHLKSLNEVKKQSGSSSLIYLRPDVVEVGVTKHSNSDVEDDDWNQRFSDKRLGSKKDERGDELKHESSERMPETSDKTEGNPDFSQNANKTTRSASSSSDDSRNKSGNEETEFESAKAVKSLEDIPDRKERQTEDDDHVFKKGPETARIDANSITYRSPDPGIGQAQTAVASKIFEESLNSSIDEKTGSTESLDKKPQKARKKDFDSGPKVKIIKQKVPMFPEPGDDAASFPTEVASGFQVVTEPKVVNEKPGRDLVVGKKSTSRAVKSSHVEFLGEPCRPVSDLEARELREVFKIQRKNLEKMPYDSPSSDDDDDDAEFEDRGHKAAAQKQRGKQHKDGRVTDEMIEELILRGDKESQMLVQSLLEKVTSDSDGKEFPVVNSKVKVDVPAAAAAEKPSASGGRAKAKNYPGVPQPPDGTIGCVIDKAFHLEGHDKSGTIEINISFEAGSQADDQSEPGRPYRGMTMKAFLPASGDGRETLRLMKAAFATRKLFTLERKNDDDDDVIVSNGVTFKDSADSYPDPGYLPKVMEQLRMLTEN